MIFSSHTDAVTRQILSGPLLRRVEAHRLVFWLCSKNSLEFRLELTVPDQESVHVEFGSGHQHKLPRLVIRSRLDKLLQGSCRKPHSSASDGLTAAWQWLQSRPADPSTWPAAFIMTGDQIYADDVAGPMLNAIQQLIECLGLYEETIKGAKVSDSKSLRESDYNYYRRNELLPETDNNETLQQRFFEGKRKPIFTSATADNHLLTVSE